MDPYKTTPFTKALETRVLRFVQRRRVFSSGERVLVAVSGGQDSMALLLLLSRLSDGLELDLAGVAHFDHRLRSRGEAREDESAVREVAEALAVPCVVGSGDVRGRAKRRGESIEEAARNLRFDFLRREAERLGADAVALGHTRDDRAETTLMHVLRGSGLDGLIGLRARSHWPLGEGPMLARPLLDVSRAETLRYCREAGLSPREDPTNLLLEATRNRLRHEVLPSLRRINPRLDEALARLGESAAGAADYLDAAAEAEWERHASVFGESVTFPRDGLAGLPAAIRQRLLRRAVRRLLGPAADVEAAQIALVEEALEKGWGKASLPGGLVASVTAREVRMGRPRGTRTIPETPLAVPGRTEVAGWVVMAEVVRPPPADRRPNSRLEAWLDAEAVGPGLVVRSRRPGDRLRPLGSGGEKKLQDLLVDAKVPAEEREEVPLVCASWGVAWVVGQRLDERAALREGSRAAVRLEFRRKGRRLTG